MSSQPRILIYSHDTYGLGHLRRCLLIAERLASLPEAPAVLIVTGSPRTHAFDLPEGCDTVKLPAVLKQPDGSYAARSLRLSYPEILRLRADQIRNTVESFRPDVILVDHAPVGMGGELIPLFEATQKMNPRPRIVLGMRDIMDDAMTVRRQWTKQGAWQVLEDCYDLVMVYGDPRVQTTAMDLHLSAAYPGRICHVGYLGRTQRPAPRSVEESILVTVGGGGDGYGVLSAYVEFLEQTGSRFPSTLLTGPFLSNRRFKKISRRADHLPGVDLRRFVSGADRLIGQATGVIAMAGYNTTVEILAAGVPGLLVPRETPRLEQTVRAERLARCTTVESCRLRDLTVERLQDFVESARKHREHRRCPLHLDGLDRVARVMGGLLRGRSALELSATLGLATAPDLGIQLRAGASS